MAGPYTVEIVGESVILCDTAEQAIMAVKRKMYVSDALSIELRLRRGEAVDIGYGFHHATITPHGARLVTLLGQVCELDTAWAEKVREGLASILLGSRETTSTLQERYAGLVRKIQEISDDVTGEAGKVRAVVDAARVLLTEMEVR